jgi:hypothetical protein
MNKHQKADAVERMPPLDVAPEKTGKMLEVILKYTDFAADFLKDYQP